MQKHLSTASSTATERGREHRWGAVSYTHLDVYKRQLLHFAVLGLITKNLLLVINFNYNAQFLINTLHLHMMLAQYTERIQCAQWIWIFLYHLNQLFQVYMMKKLLKSSQERITSNFQWLQSNKLWRWKNYWLQKCCNTISR